MNEILKLITYLFFLTQILCAQITTSCQEGEVGVVVSLLYTQTGPNQVSWDIQDNNGVVLGQSPFAYAANFLYVSDEICLPEGESYTFNAYDAGGNGWGSNSYYEVGMCGGNTLLINNNGNAPSGDGVSQDFYLPVVSDNCFCFSLNLSSSSASSTSASDGSVQATTYGGNPPFTFEWSNGVTSQNLDDASPGIYVLSVIDNLGCEITQMVEIQGPNIYMSPIDVNVCTGYFYDSGGPSNNFSSGENFEMTICSDDPELSSAIDFTTFDLSGSFFSSPEMTIYDGNSIFSPVLYSYSNSGDPSPGNISATDQNSSGCLTVVFSSNNFESSGWTAEINCQYPCQEFTVEIESSDLINAQGEIEACSNIDLNALTTFPDNNSYYNQTDNTTAFEWVFGDDQVSNLQSISYLYAEEGEYELSVIATDVNGCSAEALIVVINDAPGLTTSLFSLEDSEICPETLVQVSAVVPDSGSGETSFFESITWVIVEDALNVGEDFGDPIYLPDGSGVSYETFVNVDAFDPAAILDDDDFVEICAEIEHSYLGDLDMSLTSPNGTTVSLFTQVGGSTWLGNALDNDATQTAGECYNYCWSIEPEFGTFANSLGNTIQAPFGGNTMIPGSYEPLGDFSDFEGSGANGVWTLTITDNLAIDNGFICSWGLTMNVVGEEEEVVVDSLVSEVISYNWYCAEEPSSIIGYDSTMISVQPSLSGIHTYVMTVADNFGCEYTEEFILDVYTSPQTAPNAVSECIDTYGLSVSDVPPGGGYWEWLNGPLGATVSFDPDTNSLTPDITVSELGYYTFSFTDYYCDLSDQMIVDFQSINPIIPPTADVTCFLDNTISVIDPTGNGGQWEVLPTNTFQAEIEDLSATETTLTVSDYGSYDVVFTLDFCYGTDTMDINFLTVDPDILNMGIQKCDWEVDLEVDNPSTTTGAWDLITQPNHTSAYFSSLVNESISMEVDDFGSYQMQYTIAGCETSDTVMIQFKQVIPSLSFDPLLRCELQTELSVVNIGMGEEWSIIDAPGEAILSNPLASEIDLYVSEYGDYTLSYTGCDTTLEFNVLFMCELDLPNVFSPNGDGVNDLFIVENLTNEYYSYSNLSVYNRWGDEVYRDGNYGLNGTWWDGQSTHQNDPLHEGVYFYVLRVGNKISDERDEYRGTVHLMN
jgi:gliding motility-associated-like protein